MGPLVIPTPKTDSSIHIHIMFCFDSFNMDRIVAVVRFIVEKNMQETGFLYKQVALQKQMSTKCTCKYG